MTWDMEGSLNVAAILRGAGRTEIRSAEFFQPVAPRHVVWRSATSGTAFLVMNGVEEARAAQRRPGAEHRARPALR